MNSLQLITERHDKEQDPRTKRQFESMQKWLRIKGKGTIVANTGFGKTRIALELINLFRRDNNSRSILVVVPTLVLKKQWNDLLIQWNLATNSEVIVINSLIKRKPFKVDFLINDEIHNIAATTFAQQFDIIEYNFILGLTGTFERLDGKHEMLEEYAPIIDDIPMRLSRKEGWVSEYRHYNLGISLSEIDADIYKNYIATFTKAMDFFEQDYELLRKCSYSVKPNNWGKAPPVVKYAKHLGWSGNSVETAITIVNQNLHKKAKDRVSIWGNKFHVHSPERLYIWAIVGARALRQVMKFIYEHPSKVETAIKLIETFDRRTITFGQYISTAQQIADYFGNSAVVYHSNMTPEIRKVLVEKEYKTTAGAKKWITKHPDWSIKEKHNKIFVQTYKDKKISTKTLKIEAMHKIRNYKRTKVIATAKALNEGVDIANLELGIKLARTSSKLTEVQALGRIVRKHTFNDGTEKDAVFVDVYLKDTKDEWWMRKSQQGLLGQHWVDSIEELLEIEAKYK